MAVLEKKNTLIRTITFMAIMAAINFVLSFASNYIPFLTLILVIVLPLTSAVVEVACEDKYFPIYVIATVGLGFVALDFAIFYLIPSVVTGYIFGLMAKKKLKPVWAISIATVAQAGLLFAFVPLIELITEKNIVNDIINLFGKAGWRDLGDYVIVIFFLISLIQIILSYFVVNAELSKLGIERRKLTDFDSKLSYFIFGSIALSIPLLFIYKGLSYFFVIYSIFLSMFLLAKFIDEKSYKKLIISAIAIFLNIFVFAVFNPLMTFGAFLLIQFAPLVIASTSLFKF